MKQFYRYTRSILLKKLYITFIILFIVFSGMVLLWGNTVYSYIKGPQSLSNIESELETVELIETNTYKHKYYKKEIEYIVGSYAEFRSNKNEVTTVYYLNPINNKNYYLTVIANPKHYNTLTEMENAFYNSIGKKENIYVDPIQVNGSLRLMNIEEKKAAITYFNKYNNDQITLDNLQTYISPYVFVIDCIDQFSLSFLSVLKMLFMFVGIIIIIITVLIVTHCVLLPTYYDVKKLRLGINDIEYDFLSSQKICSLCIGTNLIYVPIMKFLRIFRLSDVIWFYSIEHHKKSGTQYDVYIHLKKGKKYKIYRTTNRRNVKRILQILSSNCNQYVLGYYDELYEIWKKDKKHFYMYLKDANMIE